MAKKLSDKQHAKLEDFLEPFRITKGKGFRLSQIDTDDSRGVKSKDDAAAYAQDQWGVLLQGLARLDLEYPKVDEAKKKELAAARAALGGDAREAQQ